MGARPFFYMKFIATLSVDYSFEVNSIETKAPTFFGHINSFLGSVPCAKHAACSYNDPLFLLLPLFLLCFRLQTSSKKSRLKEPFYAFYLLADSNCHPDCSWLPTFFVIALFFADSKTQIVTIQSISVCRIEPFHKKNTCVTLTHWSKALEIIHSLSLSDHYLYT